MLKTAFIFCNRKKDVDTLCRNLKKKGYNAGSMHGDMAQNVRNQTLEAFKDGGITLLVCSDVAARGIDVSAVSHVFNYDVPYHPDDYVHRIGRTGRAGKSGEAWMLATSDDEKYVVSIEEIIKRKIPVEKSVENKSSVALQNKQKPQKKTAQKSKQDNIKSDNSDAQGFGEDMPAFFSR